MYKNVLNIYIYLRNRYLYLYFIDKNGDLESLNNLLSELYGGISL